MEILYYDCFSGLSGDMNLGAMIDLGVDSKYLIDELKKLKLNDFEIEVCPDMRKGISGTKVDVILKNEKHHHEDNSDHKHEHGHKHDHAEHKHVEHKHHHAAEHVHRNLKDIETIIDESDLSAFVKDLSKKIFMELAIAEAKVHNKDLYEIHFHEVGAVDAIVDICGAAICFDYLKVDKVLCSSIELGGGFVNCAHGKIPVPAPATIEILKGVPVKTGAVQFETCTPTGAAIIKTICSEYSDKIDFTIDKIAYGIGTRDTEIPNVLRLYLGHDNVVKKDLIAVVEANIDDMNPEDYELVMDDLFVKGALDVFLTPIIMKKSRPAVKISILVEKSKLEEIEKSLITNTSTFGFRQYEVSKTNLQRDFEEMNTKYGKITIKNAYFEGKKIKSKLEYEDIKDVLSNNNISKNDLLRELGYGR